MSETISFLQSQLDEARQNLQLIQERKSQYVLSTDLPLQLIKEERSLSEHIKRLEKQIAMQQGETGAQEQTQSVSGARQAQSPTGQQAQRPSRPLAFMSYSHFDDEHLNNALSTMRDRLSAEVRLLTGQEFPIFQDKQDIAWGQNWKMRLEQTLDTATFLIPILTPSFFNSEYCREEVKRFARREEQIGRNDLILPIYYINYEPFNQKGAASLPEEIDQVVRIIAGHNYIDWREFRYEPFDAREVRKKLTDMAQHISRVLSSYSY